MPIWLFRQIQGYGYITKIPTREEAAGGLDDIRISEVLGGIFATDLPANCFCLVFLITRCIFFVVLTN
jgi:hypothetical protein